MVLSQVRFSAILLGLLLLPACPVINAEKAPLPDKIRHAKTVFLLNEAGDGKAIDALYSAVKSWGKFEIVQDRSKADLVFLFSDKSNYIYAGASTTGARIGTQTNTTTMAYPVNMRSFYLRVLDSGSGEALWTESRIMYWTPSKTAKLLVERLKDRAKASPR